MTIPTLMTKIQKSQTETKLKRAYAVINQAYRLSYDENGDMSSLDAMVSGMTSKDYFDVYWAPYLRNALMCNTYSQCGYKSIMPFKYINGSLLDIAVVDSYARVTFYTPDGFLYIVFLATGSKNGWVPNDLIYLDINGGAGPNIVGKDLFIFVRVANGGGVRPFGYNKNEDAIKNDCSITGAGSYCAERIYRNGWVIDKDYPW